MKLLKSALSFVGFWFLFMFLSSIAFTLVAQSDPTSNASMAVAVFAVVGAPILAYFTMRFRSKQRHKRRVLERTKILTEVRRHRAALSRNVQRAVKKNDYGVIIDDRSSAAIQEFLQSIALDPTTISFGEAEGLVRGQLTVANTIEANRDFDASLVPVDGHEFEQWVATSLGKFGWKAEVTSGSGDQGIDVIATNGTHEIGIQCKLYSSSVGNKAVQEAIAGKLYYQLPHAAVLSNAQFTQSAKDLARMSGVILLSQHDIPSLSKMLTP